MVEIKVRGVKVYRSRGKLYAYHRRTGARIRAPFGTAAFLAEVERLNGQQPAEPKPGTMLAHLWPAIASQVPPREPAPFLDTSRERITIEPKLRRLAARSRTPIAMRRSSSQPCWAAALIMANSPLTL